MAAFDSASLATIVIAAACLGTCAALKSTIPRVVLILIAALVIRIDPARQTSLHTWDEQFHAVVAKHMIAHPLAPTLYQSPLSPPAPDDWAEAHVWLHKPPMTMWLMALSMKMFGVGAFVMRLPSVVMSTIAVLLTFLIGRRLFGDSIGLLAATFQTVNGLLVELASGRRVADHVDTALITCVELAIFLALVDRAERASRWNAMLVGAAFGAAWLAKSFPALIVIAVVAQLEIRTGSLWSALKRFLWISVGAGVVAGPWLIYASAVFPAEQSAATAYSLRHLTSVMEGHGGPIWAYLLDMPKFFGELVFVPFVWFLWRAAVSERRPLEQALLVWLLVPYVVFSLVPTKLPAFVAIAAPAMFIVQALFWRRLRDNLGASRLRRTASIFTLIALLVLPARHLLEPTGVFERRDRTLPAIAALRQMDQTIGSDNAVIFNASSPYELMFYTRYDAYSRLPHQAEVTAAKQSGTTVVIMVPAGGTKPSVPKDWNIRWMTDATFANALRR